MTFLTIDAIMAWLAHCERAIDGHARGGGRQASSSGKGMKVGAITTQGS